MRRSPSLPGRIWIDICNSPHVLFFAPIIAELTKRGIGVFITAQDFGQTIALLNLHRIPYVCVGGQSGKSFISKISITLMRSAGLVASVFAERPRLLVSHGSRAAVIAAKLIRIPSITIDDYEHSFTFVNNVLSSLLLFPAAIPLSVLKAHGIPLRKTKQYPGFKEEVYIASYEPEREFNLATLGIQAQKVIVLIRPPATTAHYHNPRSDLLFERVLSFIEAQEDVCAILMGRNTEQQQDLRQKVAGRSRFVVPTRVFDGLTLLSCVDVMIGGGGTMNREAALLGLKTYSFFGGARPAVDLELQRQGRLRYLNSEEDVASIVLQKRQRGGSRSGGIGSRAGLHFIVNEILAYLSY